MFDFLSILSPISSDFGPRDPGQEQATQNEIDYLGRNAQAEIDHQNELNQTDWSGMPQNQAVQNEIDYYAAQSSGDWFLA